jgi:hypothetical protein
MIKLPTQLRRLLICMVTCFTPLAVSASGAVDYYNDAAGQNVPMQEVVLETVVRSTGEIVETRSLQPAAKDDWGNAAGSQYDLARDGAFEGQTITVLHFYTGESFDFSLPKAALAQKGFSVYRFIGAPPSPAELEAALAKSCQLWLISGSSQLLNAEHLAVIQRYFDEGHGLYIWGDNDPYYADANYVAEALLGTSMQGNLQGNQTVKVSESGSSKGLLANHLLSTGLEYLYEGITIATIGDTPGLEPLLYGSAGNLVTAVYQQGGKRAIIDGGFTRLYVHWDTAGTGRYVSNAAAWLANVERFNPGS